MRVEYTNSIVQPTDSGQRESILALPLDFPKHRRTFAFQEAEYALNFELCGALARVGQTDPQLETLLAAVYFAWIYRLSGEKEIAAELLLNDGPSAFVPIELEPNAAFRDIRDSIARLAYRPERDDGFEAETGFAVRRPVHALREQLIWQLLETGDAWTIKVTYDASLFRETTIARYAAYYVMLLEAALSDPLQTVAGVDILTAEDAAAYERLNATETEYARDQTVHGMIELAASLHPDKPAVSSADGELTYRQLNERANRTARSLLSRGLAKGDFVTIFMERSPELIVSLLGILKAGGVYVPVDPEHPEERNRYIVEDTRSAFILTKDRYLNGAKDLCAGIATVKEVLPVDAGFADFDGKVNPEVPVRPEDLAYIIYTSGSTGRPKGALIRHGGVVNLGETVRRDCRIEPHDVLTQFSTYSFDASVWDTIGALFYGATLYLLSPEERISVELFASAVERTGTTIIAILPTVFFNELTAYLSDEGYRKMAGVKLITVAGEALYGEQVRAFQRKFRDNIDIVNVYGPTECTVCTTTHVVRELISDDLTNVPIGRPIGNYKIYIVNEANRLSPVNVHGEVYISTVGLAEGYLNQPAKTAEAFIASPFAEGERIYRSGDIAKLLPDGTIEYVGRRDSQIKIRGHRIEIGEIEDSFIQIPNVQNVAVIPKKDRNGRNMLLGYFTSRDGRRMPAVDIKRQLGDKLPSYFVPKRIVQLDEMPLSPTGKIDRKKLAGFEHPDDADASIGPLPETEAQIVIAEAWKEALELEQVGIRDDFFEIGGDSLAIMHVLLLLKPHYPALKINDFYNCRTVEALAEQLKERETFRSLENDKLPAGAKTALDEHPHLLPGGRFDADDSVRLSGVLLTGATGYLGSRLLYDLLHQSGCDVYCLVRKTGKWTGMARLQDTMTHYFGPASKELMKGRVYAIEGNLEEPGLGLSEEDAMLVRTKIGAILHSAADVRHFGDEERFTRTNVAGTRHLIELACQSRSKMRFHHISTLGIPEDLALSGQWESVLEKPEFDLDLNIDSVYTNSKLEAERLLFQAAKNGLDASIYRVGNLSCHSLTGLFQKNIDSNAFYRMIKAMLLLGKAMEADWEVDFTPIDYAGQAIVHLALRSDTSGRLFHICNPAQLPYATLLEWLRGFGYAIETMEASAYTDWLLHANAADDLEAVKLAAAQLEGDGAKHSGYRYGCSATTAFLEGTGIGCPAPDKSFVQRMVRYATEIGYFPDTSPVTSTRP